MSTGCQDFLDQSPPADDGVTIFNVGQIQVLPLKFQDIKSVMRRYPTLSKVFDCVKRGWTKEIPEDVQPYIQHQNELSIENGCLLWEYELLSRSHCKVYYCNPYTKPHRDNLYEDLGMKLFLVV